MGDMPWRFALPMNSRSPLEARAGAAVNRGNSKGTGHQATRWFAHSLPPRLRGPRSGIASDFGEFMGAEASPSR
jgi:hypothetical protein